MVDPGARARGRSTAGRRPASRQERMPPGRWCTAAGRRRRSGLSAIARSSIRRGRGQDVCKGLGQSLKAARSSEAQGAARRREQRATASPWPASPWPTSPWLANGMRLPCVHTLRSSRSIFLMSTIFSSFPPPPPPPAFFGGGVDFFLKSGASPYLHAEGEARRATGTGKRERSQRGAREERVRGKWRHAPA